MPNAGMIAGMDTDIPDLLREHALGWLPAMAAAEFLITNHMVDKAIAAGAIDVGTDEYGADYAVMTFGHDDECDRRNEPLGHHLVGYLSGGEQASLILAEMLARGVFADQFFRLDGAGREALVNAIIAVMHK